MFRTINQNQTQILTLTALRDSLLPKLMSGEVRVSEHDLKDYKMDKITLRLEYKHEKRKKQKEYEEWLKTQKSPGKT